MAYRSDAEFVDLESLIIPDEIFWSLNGRSYKLSFSIFNVGSMPNTKAIAIAL